MILQPIKKGYGEFKLFKENRDLSQNNIDNIKDVIQETYLLDLYPIVTDMEKVIADGQHRFSVSRELLLPFYAIQSPNITIEDIAKANSNTRPYSVDDARHVYAALGMKAYEYINAFIENHASIRKGKKAKYVKSRTVNILRWLDPSCSPSMFIDGNFVIRKPEYAHVVCSWIRDYCDIQEFVERSRYVDAIANLALNPIYDHKRMMGRLARIPTRLKKVATLEEAFEVLTEIYNYGIKEESRLSLSKVVNGKQVDTFDKTTVEIDDGGVDVERGVIYRPIEIKESIDYDWFKLHPCRRPISEYHLTALIEYMRSKSLLDCYPIICDRSGLIIDGQSRFLAAKELGLPVFYIESSSVSLPMIVRASCSSRAWTPTDYLKHYCVVGNQSYLDLAKYLKKYPFIRLKVAMDFMSESGNFADVRKAFMLGQFKAFGMEDAVRLAEGILALNSPKLRTSLTFQYVAKACMLYVEGFDLGFFVKQANAYPERMEGFVDRATCFACVECTYNWKNRSNKIDTMK